MGGIWSSQVYQARSGCGNQERRSYELRAASNELKGLGAEFLAMIPEEFS
jgi:hypothetical protein